MDKKLNAFVTESPNYDASRVYCETKGWQKLFLNAAWIAVHVPGDHTQERE
jgi:hypothetical protein